MRRERRTMRVNWKAAGLVLLLAVCFLGGAVLAEALVAGGEHVTGSL